MIEKLKMQTPNITEQNMEQIATLFPNVMTETQDERGKVKKAIDFDLLKQSLSSVLVDDADERYRLDWPGKKAALLKANTPITKTLRPCRDDSVNFDSTENVYIEGDNFEVLKILQESYLGKIKMIYIDPPYNTGKDFIYKDNFTAKKADYEEELGTTDEEDNKLFKNTDTNGRFHSDWLSMMYERLVVARDLLKEDGVIFISIDDNEVHNLRGMCDEVFGEENFEGNIHWRRRHNQPNDKTKMIGLVAEHIISYSKNKEKFKESGVGKIELTGNFSNPDNDPKGDWASKPWKVGSDQSGSRYTIETPTGVILDEEWMGERITFDTHTKDGRIYFSDDGKGLPRKKYYKFERENEGQCATNWWNHDKFGHNQEANDDATKLFGQKNIFSNPKPAKLLKNLLNISNVKKGSLVLDFFSGSGTLSESVMNFNFENNSSVKYILVQLQENLDDTYKTADSKTKKQLESSMKFLDLLGKPHFITEIGKERIRRAGNKIVEDNQGKADIDKLDIGFRVYKTDSSNMKEVYYHPEQLTQDDIFSLESNIKKGREPDDLLTQVILDLGLELNLPIEQKEMHGNNVFIVQTNALVACFDDNINIKIIDEIAALKPFKVVFKDASFSASKDRINLEERFKRLSPETLITVI